MQRSKVIVLNQSSPPELLDLCERLVDEVGPTILVTGKWPKRTLSPGLEVVQAPAYDNRNYRTRLRTWSSYLAFATGFLMRQRGPATLLVSTNPPLLPWVAGGIARTRGWPWIAQILDVYPDTLAGRGLVSTDSLPFRFFAFGNQLAFRGAHEVITLGPVMAERISNYMPAGRRPKIVPNWVDPEQIRPIAKEDNWFARTHDQVGAMTVLYSGNAGLTHDLSGLLDAAERLRDQPGIRFMFVGGGTQRDNLAAAAARLDNVTHLDLQPLDVVPYSIATGDVGVVCLGRGAEGVSMPSKCYHLMGAGCAILGLGFEDDDVQRTIVSHDCGIALQANDGATIAAQLLALRDDPKRLQRYKRNSRAAVEQLFSRQKCTRAYVQAIRAAAFGEEGATAAEA